MSGELEEIPQDVKPLKRCPVCKRDVSGSFQGHVHVCSVPTYDGFPQAPRSPRSKKRLHESISQCRGKFRTLESPIRAQIIGSLKRLACNSTKMCPTELSSPPKRPLSPRALSSKDQDPISRLDDSIISMLFSKKEEHISKEFRSKKRKPEPSFSVSSPLQDIRGSDKRQRASPISPPSLGVLTPGYSTPSPSLPSLPGTPETPIDFLPSSPTRSTPPFTPGWPDEPIAQLSDLPDPPEEDEKDFDYAALSPIIIGEATQVSSISPPQSGGVSQFVGFSAPAQSSMSMGSQLPFTIQPTVTSLASSKQAHYLEDEDESTFNFDSSPSYSSTPITSERELKESNIDKLRFFILQHQQLLVKAEQLLGSFHTDGSKHSMGSWLPPEVNDIQALTRQLDQIAHFTSQRLQQIAQAAKIHEYMAQSSLPSPPPSRHPFQPVSLASHLDHYGRFERDFEFLVKTVQSRRSEYVKRLVDQIVDPQ